MRNVRRALGCGLLALLASTSSRAESVTALMNISATVPASCTLGTSNLSFGVIGPDLSSSATASLSINCPQGLDYQISIDAGQNYDSDRGIRSMAGPEGAVARYSIYKDAAAANQWGDSDFARTYRLGSSVAGVGSGAVQTLTVFGRVSPAANAGLTFPAGDYHDQLIVTVNY